MPVLRYHDHFIAVFLTPDRSGNSCCIPFVEIRYKRDGSPLARLMLEEAFNTPEAAKAHGLEMGKRWIDKRVAESKSAQLSGAVPNVASKKQPVPFGFKTWFASLFA